MNRNFSGFPCYLPWDNGCSSCSNLYDWSRRHGSTWSNNYWVWLCDRFVCNPEVMHIYEQSLHGLRHQKILNLALAILFTERGTAWQNTCPVVTINLCVSYRKHAKLNSHIFTISSLLILHVQKAYTCLGTSSIINFWTSPYFYRRRIEKNHTRGTNYRP